MNLKINYLKKIILCISILGFLLTSTSYAGVVDLNTIGNGKSITDVSINSVAGGDSLDKLNNAGFNILHTIKIIISGIILIYLVYLGFMMIMAMGAEDKLTTSKRQIYYSLLAFLFINIPGQIYSVFSGKHNEDVTAKADYKSVDIATTDSNIFVNFFNWNSTVELKIISFIKALVVGLVIFIFMMASIGLISSGGNDEKRKKAQKRFLNGILGLIFIGVIQAWTYVAYMGDIPKGQTLFAQLSNLALFFAGPIAIFFLIIGGFYYISSAGDEAKAKKGVTILRNTFIAVIILLASYAFLKDLADFKL